MTNEQQQPKEHCEHECVCGVLMVGGIEGDTSPCDFTGCGHDTRSRPHPAPQAPSCQRCVDEMATFCRGCPNLIAYLDKELKKSVDTAAREHDAAIERKAREDEREKVLDSIINFRKTVSKTCDVQTAWEKEGLHIVYLKQESLRSKPGKQEQPR